MSNEIPSLEEARRALRDALDEQERQRAIDAGRRLADSEELQLAGRPLDEIVIETFRRHLSANVRFHDPLSYNFLLGDMSSLVTRLVSYEREIKDLEVRAVETRARLKVDRMMIEVETSMAELGLDVELLRRSAERHSEIAEKLETSGDSSDPAHALMASARAESERESLEQRERLLALILRRSDQLEAYRRGMDTRARSPASGLNHLERRERLIRLFVDDLLEVLSLMEAVSKGVRIVLELDLNPIRKVDDSAPLLTLLLEWTTRSMRQVEFAEDSYIHSELMVSTRVPYVGTPLVENSAFSLAISRTRELKFHLGDRFKGLRLRSIGLSFVVRTDKDGKPSYLRGDFDITLPRQDETDGRPARFTIGGCAPFGPQYPVSRVEGLAIHNSSPMGDWRIHIPSELLDASAGSVKVTDEVILDIRLHLGVLQKVRRVSL